MRARIRTAEFKLEFDGDPSVWNDIVRPVMGGPAAATPGPVATEPPAAAPAPAPRPPRDQQPASVTVEPHPEPRELYRRLTEAGGRRSEKDAVVAAVWFVGGPDGDATADEVQQHLLEHDAFADARVKPVMLKHVSRSHLLERSQRAGAVRLTQKGREYVRSRLVGAT